MRMIGWRFYFQTRFEEFHRAGRVDVAGVRPGHVGRPKASQPAPALPELADSRQRRAEFDAVETLWCGGGIGVRPCEWQRG